MLGSSSAPSSLDAPYLSLPGKAGARDGGQAVSQAATQKRAVAPMLIQLTLLTLVVLCGTFFVFSGGQLLLELFRRPKHAIPSEVVDNPPAAPVRDGPGGPGAPLAKQVVVGMDTNILEHVAFDDWRAWSSRMEPFWTKGMVYDFSFTAGWFPTRTVGLRAWFDAEHMHYNLALPDCQFADFIRAATSNTCTSASYGVARWVSPIAGVPPPSDHPIVHVPDLDFYLLEGDRIAINWCLIDVLAIFEEVGYRVLPPSPLSYHGYQPPSGMDGFPAPLSMLVTSNISAESERVWRAALEEDFEHRSLTAQWWARDAVWYGPAGIGTATSQDEYIQHFLEPLHAAFSGLSRSTDQVVCEGTICGAHFYLYGNHTGSWLGAAPTGRRVPLRCGAHARIVDGVIVQGWLILDIPLAFHAMGIDLYARAADAAVARGDP